MRKFFLMRCDSQRYIYLHPINVFNQLVSSISAPYITAKNTPNPQKYIFISFFYFLSLAVNSTPTDKRTSEMPKTASQMRKPE